MKKDKIEKTRKNVVKGWGTILAQICLEYPGWKAPQVRQELRVRLGDKEVPLLRSVSKAMKKIPGLATPIVKEVLETSLPAGEPDWGSFDSIMRELQEKGANGANVRANVALKKIETSHPESIEVKEPSQQEPKSKGWWSPRWLLLLPAMGLVLLGLWSMIVWGQNRDNILFALGGIGIPVGAYLAYWIIAKRESDVVIVLPGGMMEGGGRKKKWAPANSVNIFARMDEETEKIHPEAIHFSWVDKPLGQPQQCINDGKWYFVHIFDLKTKQLKAFMLPDNQYFDPGEFANVIKMPAHRRLFAQTTSMFQKVAIGMMVLALVIEGVVLIAVKSPGG